MTTDSGNLINMDAAAAVIEVISKHPEVARICLFEPQAAPLVQERFDPSGDESEAIKGGADLKQRYKLPFWDGVLLSCFDSEEPPTRILRAASYHNPSTESLQFLDREALSAEKLRNIAHSLAAGRMLAVSSRVELYDGSRRHFPMLDFHCPPSPENLRLAQAVIDQLDIGDGFILESGKSYHFYGERLITQEELTKFLGRALLYAPIIDRAWIAHQLIESACALRISPRRKDGDAPRVVIRTSSL